MQQRSADMNLSKVEEKLRRIRVRWKGG